MASESRGDCITQDKTAAQADIATARDLLLKIVSLADDGLIQETDKGSHIAPLFFGEARAFLKQEKVNA